MSEDFDLLKQMEQARRLGHAPDPLTTERLRSLLKELEKQRANENQTQRGHFSAD
ncbi:MAG: hypothetical protein NTZ72_10765 [Afipia sp.]|nr:hypothetical protein [Afipia sp.]